MFLLQVCPDNMENLVLGVLVDLCENPKVSRDRTYSSPGTHIHTHNEASYAYTHTLIPRAPSLSYTVPPLQAIPHVVAWRAPDDNDHSVWSLLARLWRKEEQEMGVPREYMNTLAGALHTPCLQVSCMPPMKEMPKNEAADLYEGS